MATMVGQRTQAPGGGSLPAVHPHISAQRWHYLLVLVSVLTLPSCTAFTTAGPFLLRSAAVPTGAARNIDFRNPRAASASSRAGGSGSLGDWRMKEEGSALAGRREALMSAAALLFLGAAPDRAAAVTLPQLGIESQGAGGAGLKTLSRTGVQYTGRLEGGKETPGAVTYELVGSDGKPVLISFSYPEEWSASTRKIQCSGLDYSTCSSGDISVRDLRAGLSAFLVVAPAPASGALDAAFLKQSVYGKDGKYGAYGAPDEVSVAKTTPLEGGLSGALLDVKFTAFTPNMRTLAKRSLISAVKVGPDVFMLVATTTDNAFKKDAPTLRKIADSFAAAPAPDSNARR